MKRLPLHPPSSDLTRREFFGTTAKAALVLGFPTIIPSRVLGLDGSPPPSEKVAVGLIGCGEIARGQAHYAGDAVVAAVCDVRPERRAEFKEKYGGCPDYADFRDLLALDSIDAVHVSTPDHWHIAMAVMAAEAGKHMNVEKPLSLSVDGLRALDKALAGKNLVFQFNTEARGSSKSHQFVNLAANGYIGKISEAYIWAPGGWKSSLPNLAEQPVPDGLDWELWLGPAPERPFNQWRLGPGAIWNIHDYSLGMMANWGIHPMNLFQWWADVAGLGVPVAYRGMAPLNPDPGVDNVMDYNVELEYANGFKARFLSSRGPEAPGIPGFRPDVKYPKHGVSLVGEKGWLSVDVMGGPAASFADYAEVMKAKPEAISVEVRASKGSVNQDFINAIKTGEPSVCDWPSTLHSDMIPVLVDLVGRSGGEVRWDPATLTASGTPAVPEFLRREMRDPWGKIVYKYLEA